MLKLTTFIHYELIIINAKCGARAYANCIVVRALQVRRWQLHSATPLLFWKMKVTDSIIILVHNKVPKS